MTTTKKLVWRLKEAPSPESLGNLVTQGLLSKEEAREILFNQEDQEDRDIKNLESEIKFLRELVEKLSKSKTEIVETIRYIEKPYYNRHWYALYDNWCNGPVTYMNAGGNVGVSTGLLATITDPTFSSIKTF